MNRLAEERKNEGREKKAPPAPPAPPAPRPPAAGVHRGQELRACRGADFIWRRRTTPNGKIVRLSSWFLWPGPGGAAAGFLLSVSILLAGCGAEPASWSLAESGAGSAQARETACASVAETELAGASSLLAAALSWRLGGAFLGEFPTSRSALLNSREAGRRGTARRLAVCELLAYDPYDPAKVKVRLALYEPASSALDAEFLLALSRAPSETAAAPAGAAPSWERTFIFNAGEDALINEFIKRRLAAERPEGRRLLASIRLRDEGEFMGLIAEFMAEELGSSVEPGEKRADPERRLAGRR